MNVSVQPSAESTVLIFIVLAATPLFVSVFFYMRQGLSPGFYFVSSLSLLMVLATFLLGGSASIQGNKFVLKGVITSTELKTTDVSWEPLDNPGRVTSRTFGVGAPGFASGWFKSSAGRKVYVLSTSSDPVYLPTNQDYDIVLDRAVFTQLKSAAEAND